MAHVKKNGVLVVNLGSPDSTKTEDVRSYLKEFLMDGRVIDIPGFARWLLVHLIILPTRPKRSAKAYKKVWTDEGSPLIVYGQQLTHGLIDSLGEDFHVELAMRYGNPSMQSAVEALRNAGCDRIIVVPLYPQYASATTGSIYEKLMQILKSEWNIPEIVFVGDFFDDQRFIDSFAAVAKPHIEEFKPDMLLFSYHGLPKRHLLRGDSTGEHCQKKAGCCDVIESCNRFCYRAQCMATSQSLAQALGLGSHQHTTSFQSRLGRAEWIRPYTDDVTSELAKKGVKRLAVMCPAFVADCLETLEEIGMELKEQWLEEGGEDFRLIPSLNSNKVWLKNLSDLIRSYQ
jgi:ferrochelatase